MGAYIDMNLFYCKNTVEYSFTWRNNSGEAPEHKVLCCHGDSKFTAGPLSSPPLSHCCCCCPAPLPSANTNMESTLCSSDKLRPDSLWTTFLPSCRPFQRVSETPAAGCLLPVWCSLQSLCPYWPGGPEPWWSPPSAWCTEDTQQSHHWGKCPLSFRFCLIIA